MLRTVYKRVFLFGDGEQETLVVRLFARPDSLTTDEALVGFIGEDAEKEAHEWAEKLGFKLEIAR